MAKRSPDRLSSPLTFPPNCGSERGRVMADPTSPPVRPREIASWAMFDFANSSYTTLIVTVAYGNYFTQLVAPGRKADLLWSVGILLSNLLVMLAGPVVGAIADLLGRKKVFLVGTYLLCVLGTLALYWVQPGMVVLGLALFVISNIGFSFGENLVAAFLPEISTSANVGRISGFGWGLGYLGGLLCLVLCRPFLAAGFTVENLPNVRLAWVVTAGFFAVAAIPTFVFLRERAPRGEPRRAADYVRVSLGRLWETAKAVRHFSELARFLVVFFVFSLGLTAVISFSAIYASKTLQFTPDELTVLFIGLQLSSAVGAVVFGFIQDRLGARRTIQLTLVLWIAVCVACYLADSKSFFTWVAIGAGFGIGSLQAASRGLVGMFSPIEKSGEFFGLWGFAGKGAYMLGPFIFGSISSATGSQRLAILSVGLFFLLGFFGMMRVSEARGREAAVAWRAQGAAPG